MAGMQATDILRLSLIIASLSPRAAAVRCRHPGRPRLARHRLGGARSLSISAPRRLPRRQRAARAHGLALSLFRHPERDCGRRKLRARSGLFPARNCELHQTFGPQKRYHRIQHGKTNVLPFAIPRHMFGVAAPWDNSHTILSFVWFYFMVSLTIGSVIQSILGLTPE